MLLLATRTRSRSTASATAVSTSSSHAGDAGHLVDRGVAAPDHRRGLDEAAARLGALGQPADDQRGVGARRRHVHEVPARRQLVQERAEVQRHARGQVEHAPEDVRGQREVALADQRARVVEPQRPERDAHARGDPREPVRQQVEVVGAGREDHQHRIADQPAHGEQQRAQRRGVGPVRVVDDDDGRARALKLSEQLEQRESDAGVVRGGAGDDRRREISGAVPGARVDRRRRTARSAPRRPRPPTARARRPVVDDVPDQRGLADATRAVDEDERRFSAARVVERGGEAPHFVLAAAERSGSTKCFIGVWPQSVSLPAALA